MERSGASEWSLVLLSAFQLRTARSLVIRRVSGRWERGGIDEVNFEAC